MKIYIVTSGEYSDYHIEKVFSTKELAEEFVQYHGSDYRVETFDVDEEFERKEKTMWRVEINTNSLSSVVKWITPTEDEDAVNGMCCMDSFWDANLLMFVECDTQERARKIAYERYVAIKSNPLIWTKLTTKQKKRVDAFNFVYVYPQFNVLTNQFNM